MVGVLMLSARKRSTEEEVSCRNSAILAILADAGLDRHRQKNFHAKYCLVTIWKFQIVTAEKSV